MSFSSLSVSTSIKIVFSIEYLCLSDEVWGSMCTPPSLFIKYWKKFETFRRQHHFWLDVFGLWVRKPFFVWFLFAWKLLIWTLCFKNKSLGSDFAFVHIHFYIDDFVLSRAQPYRSLSSSPKSVGTQIINSKEETTALVASLKCSLNLEGALGKKKKSPS